MSTFDYLTPAEAVAAARNDAPGYLRIVGLKAIEADRLRPAPTRTRAGNSRVPEPSGREHAQLKEFREIAGAVWASEDKSGLDANPGTVTITFADGESTYLHTGDLLCVERSV